MEKDFYFFLNEGPGGDVGQLIKALDTLYIFLSPLAVVLQESL